MCFGESSGISALQGFRRYIVRDVNFSRVYAMFQALCPRKIKQRETLCNSRLMTFRYRRSYENFRSRIVWSVVKQCSVFRYNGCDRDINICGRMGLIFIKLDVLCVKDRVHVWHFSLFLFLRISANEISISIYVHFALAVSFLRCRTEKVSVYLDVVLFSWAWRNFVLIGLQFQIGIYVLCAGKHLKEKGEDRTKVWVGNSTFEMECSWTSERIKNCHVGRTRN